MFTRSKKSISFIFKQNFKSRIICQILIWLFESSQRLSVMQ